MGTFNLAYLETTLLVWGITTKDGLCTGYRLPVTTVVIEKCTYKVYIYFNMIDLVIVQFESLLYREEEITNKLTARMVQKRIICAYMMHLRILDYIALRT